MTGLPPLADNVVFPACGPPAILRSWPMAFEWGSPCLMIVRTAGPGGPPKWRDLLH